MNSFDEVQKTTASFRELMFKILNKIKQNTSEPGCDVYLSSNVSNTILAMSEKIYALDVDGKRLSVYTGKIEKIVDCAKQLLADQCIAPKKYISITAHINKITREIFSFLDKVSVKIESFNHIHQKADGVEALDATVADLDELVSFFCSEMKRTADSAQSFYNSILQLENNFYQAPLIHGASKVTFCPN